MSKRSVNSIEETRRCGDPQAMVNLPSTKRDFISDTLFSEDVSRIKRRRGLGGVPLLSNTSSLLQSRSGETPTLTAKDLYSGGVKFGQSFSTTSSLCGGRRSNFSSIFNSGRPSPTPSTSSLFSTHSEMRNSSCEVDSNYSESHNEYNTSNSCNLKMMSRVKSNNRSHLNASPYRKHVSMLPSSRRPGSSSSLINFQPSPSQNKQNWMMNGSREVEPHVNSSSRILSHSPMNSLMSSNTRSIFNSIHKQGQRSVSRQCRQMIPEFRGDINRQPTYKESTCVSASEELDEEEASCSTMSRSSTRCSTPSLTESSSTMTRAERRKSIVQQLLMASSKSLKQGGTTTFNNLSSPSSTDIQDAKSRQSFQKRLLEGPPIHRRRPLLDNETGVDKKQPMKIGEISSLNNVRGKEDHHEKERETKVNFFADLQTAKVPVESIFGGETTNKPFTNFDSSKNDNAPLSNDVKNYFNDQTKASPTNDSTDIKKVNDAVTKSVTTYPFNFSHPVVIVKANRSSQFISKTFDFKFSSPVNLKKIPSGGLRKDGASVMEILNKQRF